MPHRNNYVQTEYSGALLNLSEPPWHSLKMTKRRIFLREWRKHRGLSQERLAERMGITQGQYSKIESRRRPWDEPFLEAAADALSCEVVDILIRDPTDVAGIWSVWESLQPAQQRQLVEIGMTIKRTGTDG
jgi:DNA-binding XRE family transcriptional regulator